MTLQEQAQVLIDKAIDLNLIESGEYLDSIGYIEIKGMAIPFAVLEYHIEVAEK